MKAYEKVLAAAEKDPSILCERGKEDECFGSNPDYLLDVHGITKSDLIRLEREGLALKARYETRHPKPDRGVCGTHRVRWILYKEAV